MRYRLLARDFPAMTEEGSKIGDRDSVEAQRLGLPRDSYPPLDFAGRKAEDAAWTIGIDYPQLSVDEKVQLVQAWINGYRDAYEEAWEYEYEDGVNHA